jgi:cell division protein FtsZ
MKKKSKKVKKAKRVVKKKPVKKEPVNKKPKKKKPVKKVAKKKKIIRASEPDVFDGVHKAKIRIVGIGGGGGSIISEIVSRINKVDFWAANTDARALRGLNKKVKKFQFGQNLTKGLGTGMNVELGEQAALQEKDKIKKIFEGQDLCIIVSCLGGGTGSGTTHVFAKIARNLGCLTYGIFTLPFKFEGERKMEIAKEALKKIGPSFNVFSVIPNERIFQIIDKNTPLQDALSAINKRLVNNLEGLIEMIYLPGLINIDFADLKAVLSGYGKLAYLNTVEIAETHKDEAARKVISTPLYPYTLKGSKGILYNIVGGKSLCLSDVSRISEIISEYVNKNAKIIFGINQHAKYKDKVRITLLAAGLSSKNDLLKTKKTQIQTPKRKIGKKKEKLAAEPKIEPKIEKNVKTKIKPKPDLKSKPNPKPKPRIVKPAPKPKVVPVIKKEPEKIRRNALEVRKVIEQEEKDLLDKESVWDIPAILRKEQDQNK